MFTGLLKVCNSDDELGVILGHEMAHAVMGHGVSFPNIFQQKPLALPCIALA